MKKHLCLFAVVIFLLISALPAQDTPDLKVEGKKGILFTFNGLNLNEYDGGFGLKYYTSERLALIAGLDLAYIHDKKEAVISNAGNDSKRITTGLIFGLEKHFKNVHRVSPYIGAVVEIGYFYYSHKYLYENNNPINIQETITSRLFLSPQFNFGLEYFFTDNISLAGQYTLGGSYSSGEEKRKSETEVTRDISGITFDIRTSALILCLYF